MEGWVNGRVVERFLGASEEEKRRMQIMYGVKVLNKLIAAWEAEVADRGYLQENTVRASSLVVSSLIFLSPLLIISSHLNISVQVV